MSSPPILALSRGGDRADIFWRVTSPMCRLAEAGGDARVLEVELSTWLDHDAPDPSIGAVADRLVILQRSAVKGASADEVATRVQRIRDAGALAVVYELDDDIVSPAYAEYLDACGGLEMVSRARLLAEAQSLTWTMQAADAVTVSTEPLAEVVRRYTDKPVHVIPNAIDVEWFRARLSPDPFPDLIRDQQFNPAPRIGWAGGRRPDADLEPMAVAWGRIARRYPDVRFVVAGWQPEPIYREIEDIDQIIRVPWADLDAYPASYQVNIGCCPLERTDFNRAKSQIKAWEYALAGATVVASPTVYGDEMIYGGYIARTADDWEHALSFLIDHRGARELTAQHLREHVERHHSLTTNLPNWARAYGEIVASRARVLA